MMHDDDFFEDQNSGQAARRDLERLLEPGWLTIRRLAPGLIAGVVALVTIIGMVVLRPTGEVRPDLGEIGINARIYDAVVDDVGYRPCTGTTEADGIPCQEVTFRLTEGPDTGESVVLEYVVSDTSPAFTPGDHVVMDYNPEAELDRFRYSYYDRQRRPVLLWVAAAFVAAVVALGRMRGVAALVGLAASLLVLLQFVVPAILDGRPPVAVAIFGAAAIAYVALYAAHGFTRMTTAALLGTLAALALTGVLSWVALEAAQLTGLASDEAFILSFAGRVDLGGLILAGVVLGSMGAIDDVTVTQASAVWEVKRARPDMPRRRLVGAGLRVGRDHVASTVNTLLLAYAGASMPLLLFFVLADQSLGTVLNSEIVATEALRTLLGSIGLVASVPLTTWLAALLVEDADLTGDHHHGGGG